MSAIASAVEPRLKSVLLATDFSQTCQIPLRHALGIARHYGAKLYLAHVVSPSGFALVGPDALNAATDAARRDAHQLETQLVETGALAGLHHEFIVGQGAVWEVLNQIIRQERVDMIVSGARGRRGLQKMVLGSVAEEIFRCADCIVFTVGPGSYQESRANEVLPNRTYLFATDFDEASLCALPYAISYANQFGAKLVLLHVVPTTPPKPESLLYRASLQRLEELTLNSTLKVKPEFVVEFCPVGPISEKILETAQNLKADVIILGLRRSTHVEAASHKPWATAYEVVCGAECPVATVRG